MRHRDSRSGLGTRWVIAALVVWALAGADSALAAERGTISTVVGNGSTGFGGDLGPGPSASLGNPAAVATDSSGNLLIADTNDSRVRMLAAGNCSSDCAYGLAATTAGDVYTIAGNGTAGFTADGQAATATKLDPPMSLAVMPSGVLIGAGPARVRFLAAVDCSSACGYGLGAIVKGDLYTVAGTGTSGSTGDGSAATSAKISSTSGIAVDNSGNLLIPDKANNRVRMVAAADCASACPYGLSATTRGIIYPIAGTGTSGSTGEAAPATTAQFNQPDAVAVDHGGDVMIADTSNYRVRMIAAVNCSSGCPFGLSSTVAGDIYTVAGSGSFGASGDDGPAKMAFLTTVSGLAFDAAGNLLLTDTNNSRVRMVAAGTCTGTCAYGLSSTSTGDIYRLAGGGAGGLGDGGPATSAQLSQPEGIAIDNVGSLLIADYSSNRVRSVTNAATLSVTVAGSGVVTGGTISCPGSCTQTAGFGATVTLTATPAAGSTFTGWSGSNCLGTGTCSVALFGDQAVTATFALTPTGPTVAQVKAALAKVLVPTGKSAKIAALLKAGRYRFTFTAPSAGKLTLGWYSVPKGAHLAKAGKHKPRPKLLLVASTAASISRAGATTVTIKLTAAGRKLLKRSNRVKLIAKATFTPTGLATTTSTKTFTLRH